MVSSLVLLLCSPRYKTSLLSHDMFDDTENGGRNVIAVGYKLFVPRRTVKRKKRKHHQLAQIIKVINTVAILFIVIGRSNA